MARDSGQWGGEQDAAYRQGVEDEQDRIGCAWLFGMALATAVGGAAAFVLAFLAVRALGWTL